MHGYQGGIAFYVKNPSNAEKILVSQVLEVSPEGLHNVLYDSNSGEFKRIQLIIDRVVTEAKRHCQKKALDRNENVQFWRNMSKDFDGRWECVLTKQLDVNAFVSGFI